ncbi:hypothetical protein [Chlorogloea sp. CCALA 695]|uniref:hypothetical protein n=1 Tax=Chlorogloea sp. CCALA 695 TaxID=2107693 RepID=UPI0011B1F43C|nr:hypothetical protein [Chlorogloea sp. CCALA 695]
MALDIFPRFLQIEKISQRSLHNKANYPESIVYDARLSAAGDGQSHRKGQILRGVNNQDFAKSFKAVSGPTIDI